MLVSRSRIVVRQASRFLQNTPRRQINIAGESGRSSSYGKANRNLSAFAYLLGTIPVATFALGTWQCYRLNWKLNLIEQLEKLVKSEPAELPEDFSKLTEYTKYRVRGYFDLSQKPIFIFPRQVLDPSSASSTGGGLFSQSKSHQIGAQMIVPFVVTEARFQKLRILVNVGWVSKRAMEQIQRADFPTDGANHVEGSEIELVGVLRTAEKRQPFQPKSQNQSDYMSRRNIPKLGELFDAEQIFLDAHDSQQLNYAAQEIRVDPVGAQTRVTLRNEHLSYILTWYSLTGIFSYLWYKKIFRPRL